MAFQVGAHSAILCCLTLLGAVVSASDLDQLSPGLVEAALQRGDECAAGDEQCALAAVQLRGKREGQDVGARAGARALGNSSCGESAMGLMMKDKVPSCVKACPHICAAATPLLALVNSGGAMDMVCAREAHFSCAMEEGNAKSCEPMLEELAAAWPGVPQTSKDLAAACQAHEEGKKTSLLAADEASSTARALVARATAGDAKARQKMLDLSVMHKEADPLCENAQEGQTCVPPDHGDRYSDSYIYCSAHKRLSAGATDCNSQMGWMSRCVGGGVALTHNYCDDPFCRNGGAYGGPGPYCHNKAVVSCGNMDDAPQTVDSCSDDHSTNGNGCSITRHYECRGHHPYPRCAFVGRTKSC